MRRGNLSRRGFVQRSLATLTAAGLPPWYASQFAAAQEEGKAKKTSANDRLAMGIVGIGSPISRSLQVVGESSPCVQSGQLTFTLGCDVNAAHRQRGTDDAAINGGRALDKALTGKGIRHEWVESPGYRHDYQIWRIYLRDLLPKLFRD